MTTPEHHRHWLLELLSWWEGRITPKQLAEHWQFSRQYASSLLQDYLQAHPNSLDYQPSSKGYRPSGHFQPQLLSGDATEYLEWATRRTLPAHEHGPAHLPHATLQHPPRQITPQIIRPAGSGITRKPPLGCRLHLPTEMINASAEASMLFPALAGLIPTSHHRSSKTQTYKNTS